MALNKEQIAKRIAQELKDGFYAKDLILFIIGKGFFLGRQLFFMASLLRRTLVLLDYVLSFYRSLPATAALRYVAKQLKTVLLIFNELVPSCIEAKIKPKFCNRLYWLLKAHLHSTVQVCDLPTGRQAQGTML